MHKSEVALHYAYLKANGKDYRILTTNFKELEPGNPTSDVMGYFGLGSGEFWTPRIEGLTQGVTTVEIPDTELGLMMWKDNPRFMGFIDARPQHNPVVILKGGERSIYTLPINWEVYTQLGVQSFAKDTLGTLRRIHLAYPTPEECVDRINDIMRLVRTF